ncbi:MAG: hypothetical protein JNJ59_26240 [Deltaproteobacteria bacterium]|nr:hypothetical protein [Deltaproteobacteria bacterium]
MNSRLSLLLAPLAGLVGLATTATLDAAHASCPVEGPVTCARFQDRLVINSDAGRLTLRGHWSQRDALNRFTTTEGFAMALPGGIDLPVPGVESVTVTCGPYLAISGELTALPGFASYWPSIDPELVAGGENMAPSPLTGLPQMVSVPRVSFGLALGEQVNASLGAITMPVDACSPYFFFGYEDHRAVQVGDVWAGKMGTDVRFLLNPWDPALLVQVGGEMLDDATAGFVNKVGLGFSRKGLIHWESVLPLPNGVGETATLEPMSVDAHIWASGKYGLIPVPKSPVQLYIDGDVAIDLGPWPQVAEALANKVSAGETVDVAALIAAQVPNLTVAKALKKISIGGNLMDLALTAGPYVSLSLGQGSFLVEDGKLHFAADLWTPGSKFAEGTTGNPIIDAAMKAVIIKARGKARGYVDDKGYRFELEGSFTFGPWNLPSATLVIDSEDGVTVENEGINFDPNALLDQLREIFNCDFSDGLAACRVAGFKVLDVEARIVNGNPKVKIAVDLMGLAGGTFEMFRMQNGELKFVLQAQVPGLLGGFSLSSAKLTITKQGVELEAGFQSAMQGVKLKGALSRVNGVMRYDVAGQGKVTLVGFDLDAKARFTNVGGPSRFTLDADFTPSKFNVAFSGTTFSMHGEVDTTGNFELTANGNLKVANYPLGNLAVSLSNKTGKLGFSMRGRFDAQVVHVALYGNYQAGESEVVLAGTSDLTVEGHTLTAAAFTLSNLSGFRVLGQVNLGAVTLQMAGSIATNGAVTVSGQINIDIPVAAGFEIIRKALECGTTTISRAGQCGVDYVSQGLQWVQDRVQCGVDTVTTVFGCIDVVVPWAFEWVTDAARCAQENLECGARIVTDGTQCGFTMMQEKLPLMGQCVADWWSCALGNIVGISCDPVNQPPASCLAFAEPKTCVVDVACPTSCLVVTEYRSIPTGCQERIDEVVKTCPVETFVPVPRSCEDIVVPNICNDEVIYDPNHDLGMFHGTLSVSFGQNTGIAMTGSYCDLTGQCTSWGVGGSIDWSTPSSPKACVSIPQDVLPLGAVFGAFAVNGQPMFCTPL